MKTKCVFVSVVLTLLLSQNNYAQNNTYSFIPSEHLAITCNKTTNLIFPYSVQSIDRGSKDILVQQPKGTQNIVQVKAARPSFIQTNLSIITMDGKLYSFTVDYGVAPTQLNIVIGSKMERTDSMLNRNIMLTSGDNEALFQNIAQNISAQKPAHRKKDKDNKMEVQLNGIYVNHDVLYFRLQLMNNSNVSYDVGDVKFTVKNKLKSKRTATQEMELTPVYRFGNFKNVQVNSFARCIIALHKFTLPDSKYLVIQVLEKNGSRNLKLVLKNRQIMNAIRINGL